MYNYWALFWFVTRDVTSCLQLFTSRKQLSFPPPTIIERVNNVTSHIEEVSLLGLLARQFSGRPHPPAVSPLPQVIRSSRRSLTLYPIILDLHVCFRSFFFFFFFYNCTVTTSTRDAIEKLRKRGRGFLHGANQAVDWCKRRGVHGWLVSKEGLSVTISVIATLRRILQGR